MSPFAAILVLGSLCTLGPGTPRVGMLAEDFTLRDYRGKSHSLSEFSDRPIIVLAFLGTECPLAKLYGPRLAELHRDYEPQGVVFLGIDSNSQDSLTEIAAYARIHRLKFPVLKDLGNVVADRLQAERTPAVYVLDQQRRVRYRGRIDDQYGVGYARDKPTREDLRAALDELLRGEEISRPETQPVGCFIGRIRQPQPNSDVTYSNQISRLFQQHCVECHRAGEIAPFSLTDYDEVAGWAETIAEVIRQRRMPPWHASPVYGSFANARLMSDEEKELVYRWVRDGAPLGDPTQLPSPIRYVQGWRLPREPDLIVPMRQTPFVVPAEGTVEYQYFVVDSRFDQDRWVSAAEVIPGNRAVVHHAIVFIRPPGNLEDGELGWLSAYVPGQMSTSLQPGQAYLVPAGSKFVFQMHYTPNGSEQQDITKVGIIFAQPDTVRERVRTLISLNREFEIPPFAADYRVTAWLRRFPENSRLLALAPHMHLRGKSFRFVARGGQEERILLDVPEYDFNWQHTYRLSEPLPLTDDLRVECIAHFDNSKENLVNPDPSATVRWGDQTWQEMVVAYFGVSVPVDAEARSKEQEKRKSELSQKKLAQADAIAHDILNRFDQNGDQLVDHDEAPESFAVFAFHRFDRNGDGRITLQEARRQSMRIIRDRDERSDNPFR